MSRAERMKAVLLLNAVFALMLLLNAHTPLMMDDYDYSFSWATGERLAGVGDILASQAEHYRLWGGRSITHFLAQLFLYLGKPVFNICNAAMYCVLLLEICALAGKRSALDWRILLATHSVLFFLVPFFGVAFLWLDGACNYLWGTALALVPLLIAASEREDGFFAAGWARGWLVLPLSLLAGWTNENTACGVLASVILLIVWDRRKGRKIRSWRIAAVAAQAIGVALLLLAPGNFARAAEETGRGFVMEMTYRFAVTSYCFARYCSVPVLLSCAALLMAKKKQIPFNMERICLLAVAAFLSTYALVGSPQISDRSFTAVLCLCAAALACVLSGFNVKMKASAVLLALALCAAGGWLALGDVCAHESAWLEQIAKIKDAVISGADTVVIGSVPSNSRYTMGVMIEDDPAAWPNSTLGKYYGIRISGE